MLHKSIQRWDLVLLFINGTIGAGIFGLPSKVFSISGVYSLAAFLVCAIAINIIVLCFAEVSTRFDKTGGPYVYILEAFGRYPAFVTGWLLFLNRIFNFATLINLLVIYLSFFSTSFNDPLIRAATISLITLMFTLINHIGVKNSTRFSNIITVVKLLPLFLFVLIGLFHIDWDLLKPGAPPSISAFSTSVLLLIFAFGGFDGVLVNTGEIKNPRKDLPFALFVSSAVVFLFYCFIQFVCIGTLPGLAGSEKPLAEAAARFWGRSGGLLIAAGACLSLLGTLNAIMLSGSRLPFAFSTEQQFPKLFSFILPRYKTPTWSLLFYSVLTLVVSLSGSFIYLLTLGAITRVLLYLFVSASLIRLRNKDYINKDHISVEKKDYFRLKYGYTLAIAGMMISCWLLFQTKQNEIVAVSLAILSGIIFYSLYVWKKKSGRN
jgi:basic amino acid/polyamine antiporter, APA family